MSSFNTNSLELSVLIGSNTKISTNYEFNAEGRFLQVNDKDFRNLLFVENKTQGKLVYQILKPELGGKLKGGSVNLNNDCLGMSNSDDLLVVYEAQQQNDNTGLLVCIIDELQEMNKWLRKIYNPL